MRLIHYAISGLTYGRLYDTEYSFAVSVHPYAFTYDKSYFDIGDPISQTVSGFIKLIDINTRYKGKWKYYADLQDMSTLDRLCNIHYSE